MEYNQFRCKPCSSSGTFSVPFFGTYVPFFSNIDACCHLCQVPYSLPLDVSIEPLMRQGAETPCGEKHECCLIYLYCCVYVINVYIQKERERWWIDEQHMHRYHRFTVYNVCTVNTLYITIYIYSYTNSIHISYIYHIPIRCIRCFHSADDLQVSQEFNAPASQLLALFNKASGGTVRQGADKWWLIISDHLRSEIIWYVCIHCYIISLYLYIVFLYTIYMICNIW